MKGVNSSVTKHGFSSLQKKRRKEKLQCTTNPAVQRHTYEIYPVGLRKPSFAPMAKTCHIHLAFPVKNQQRKEAAVQIAEANSCSLLPISISHSTFIHAFTFIHQAITSGLGLSHLSCPLLCPKFARSQSFSSYLSSSHLHPGCTTAEKRASSLHFADNYNILCLLYSQIFSMKLCNILLLKFLVLHSYNLSLSFHVYPLYPIFLSLERTVHHFHECNSLIKPKTLRHVHLPLLFSHFKRTF